MLDAALREVLVGGAARMGVSLGDSEVDHFATYLGLLQLWGGGINLTTRLKSRDIIIYHFLDSLVGASFLSSTPETAVVDLGAGAGFPGIPLKIALPGLQVLLVESSRKKVSFCQEVLRKTNLGGIEAAWGRGEELGLQPSFQGKFSIVVSRALDQSAAVVKIAVPFLARGGKIILYKAEPGPAELQKLNRYCNELGASWEKQPVFIPFLDAVRSLVIVRTAS